MNEIVSPEEVTLTIKRNLAESHNALIKRRASVEMTRVALYGFGYFQIVGDALFNDILAHAARLFDRTECRSR